MSIFKQEYDCPDAHTGWGKNKETHKLQILQIFRFIDQGEAIKVSAEHYLTRDGEKSTNIGNCEISENIKREDFEKLVRNMLRDVVEIEQ